MEMMSEQPPSAAPLDTIKPQSLAALQRNESPKVPSHNPTEFQLREPRVSHASREVDNDNTSLSSTAIHEAGQTSNVDPSQRKANGIQQSRMPLTPPFNSVDLTDLDKPFTELHPLLQVSRGPFISNTLQANPESVGVGEPEAAAGKSRRNMVAVTSIAQEPFPVQVNSEAIPELNERVSEPESQSDRSLSKTTARAAEAVQQVLWADSHQMSQGEASFTRRDGLPVPPSDQTTALTRVERPELLSSNAFVVVEEEPPEEKLKTWEEDTKRELDEFLRILMKGIRKSMLATRFRMRYTKGDEKRAAKPMLATRLRMAYTKGDEKRVAKPVIIISCNTKECSKRVYKHLSGKPTLRCLELFRVSVAVETVREAALSDEDAPVPAPMSLPFVSIGVEIKHKADCLTYCGCNLRIEFWQDGVGTPSFATFGGVISVKGRFYGITTAHSFLPDPYHTLGWEHSGDEDDGVWSTSAIATSPSISIDSESVTDSELSSIADAVQANGGDGVKYELFAYLEPLSTMAYSYQGRTMKPGGTLERAHSASDWVLFPLQPSVALPNTCETHSLASVAPESQLTAGPVLILLGIDASREGYLTSPTASLHTEHAFMNVREIILKSALPQGASGAWVIRGSEVYGYVVALIGEGLSCFMIPMERTFREISELFGNDVEFGSELNDRIRANRQVDGAPGPLVAVAQRRAGEALEEFSNNNTLHPGADPDSITALREPVFQDIQVTHDLSRKAGLGSYPVDAMDPIIRHPESLFGLNTSEKPEPSWYDIARDARSVAEGCGHGSDIFLELAKRSSSRGLTFWNLLYAGKFQHLFTTLAQDLNMMQLAWNCIKDRLNQTFPSQSYSVTLQRSLNITRDVLLLLNSLVLDLYPRKNRTFAQDMWRAGNAVSHLRKLREAQRSISRLAEDAKYLQEQCRVPDR